MSALREQSSDTTLTRQEICNVDNDMNTQSSGVKLFEKVFSDIRSAAKEMIPRMQEPSDMRSLEEKTAIFESSLRQAEKMFKDQDFHYRRLWERSCFLEAALNASQEETIQMKRGLHEEKMKECEILKSQISTDHCRELPLIAKSLEDMRKISVKNKETFVKKPTLLQQLLEYIKNICVRKEAAFVKKMDLLQQEIARREEEIYQLNLSLQSVKSFSKEDRNKLQRQIETQEEYIITLKKKKKLLQNRVNKLKEAVEVLRRKSAVTLGVRSELSHQLELLIEKGAQLKQEYDDIQKELNNQEMLLSGNEVNMTDSPTTRGLSTLSTDKFENDEVTLRKHEDTSILQRDSISNDIADLLEKASRELSDKKKDDSLHGRSCTTSQERPSDFERICDSILAIQNVLMVYPAYQSENVDEVVYVVIVNIETPELIQGINDLEIKYIIKESSLSNSRKYSTSNKNQKPEKSAEIINENTFDIQTAAVGDSGEIPNHTNKKQRRTQTFKSSEMLMSDEQHERLRSCMQKYANDLMTKHKYLSIIEGSIYKVDTSGPTYEPCLVLYVPAKGFIPIGEERFNASYDDIRVFVQEGIFRLFTGHADDIHKHTRMGCQISRAAFGTLGVFIEHPFYGLCGLTSAHVVLDDTTPFSVDMNGHCYFQSNEHKVYQPISPDEIGFLKEAVIKTGCVSHAGMEIALIQLEQRFPVNGDFPKPRVGATDISFTSGKTAGLNVSDVFCFKIGSATDYTEGTIIRNSNCVRDILRRADNFVIPLFIRFKIKPRSTLFAYEGDSGAPVFVKDVTGEPVCIGIIVGGNPDTGEVFVTHIEDILREFGNSKLKSFDDFVTLSRTLSEVTDAVKQLQNGHENLLNITESKLESLKNSTENKIDELKSYISQLFMERNGVGT